MSGCTVLWYDRDNTELDTSQDNVHLPGEWPSSDAQPSYEPYRHRRRPRRGRYQPTNTAYRLSREELREMALVTLGSLDDGFYTYHSHGNEIKVDLKDAIEWVTKETSYFGPDWDGEADGERVLPEEEEAGQSAVEAQEDAGDISSVTEMDSGVADIATPGASEAADNASGTAQEISTELQEISTPSSTNDDPSQQTSNLSFADKHPVIHAEKFLLETHREIPSNVKTRIVIAEYSTLIGTRKLHHLLEHDENVKNKTIGVLNFASAKKPGGGFLNGAQAQVRYFVVLTLCMD